MINKLKVNKENIKQLIKENKQLKEQLLKVLTNSKTNLGIDILKKFNDKYILNKNANLILFG